MNVIREISKAFFNGVESRKRTKERKMRRPDMRGNKNGIRTSLQCNLQQIMAVQSQDRPAVRANIADGFQAQRQALRRVQIRQQNHTVHFARLARLFIDAADLAAQHKARRFSLGFTGQAQFIP